MGKVDYLECLERKILSETPKDRVAVGCIGQLLKEARGEFKAIDLTLLNVAEAEHIDMGDLHQMLLLAEYIVCWVEEKTEIMEDETIDEDCREAAKLIRRIIEKNEAENEAFLEYAKENPKSLTALLVAIDDPIQGLIDDSKEQS